jgi:hypothetical protein
MSSISLSSASRQSLFKIIADTPFLSSPVVLVGLPNQRSQLGLSTFEDMLDISPRRLASSLSSVQAQISGGKSATLQSLHDDLPARLASLLHEEGPERQQGRLADVEQPRQAALSKGLTLQSVGGRRSGIRCSGKSSTPQQR